MQWKTRKKSLFSRDRVTTSQEADDPSYFINNVIHQEANENTNKIAL